MAAKNQIRNNLTLIVIALVGISAGILSWHEFSNNSAPEPKSEVLTHQATVLPKFKEMQPFSLTDHRGNPFNNQTLTGQWTLLNFGYTFCPDVCPTTLALLAELDGKLQAMESVHPYQITFVSVDPERDTLQQLSEYISHFNPSFLGATGPDEELKRLTRQLGILYAKVLTDEATQNYVMDHSASIILVDPQGRYHAIFSPPHDAGYMADDFIAITTNY